jgi:hypothetical protein
MDPSSLRQLPGRVEPVFCNTMAMNPNRQHPILIPSSIMLQYYLSFSWLAGPCLCNINPLMIWMMVSNIGFNHYILSTDCLGFVMLFLSLVQYGAGWNTLLCGNWCASSVIYDHKGSVSRTYIFDGYVSVPHWNSEDSSMPRVLLNVLVEDVREIPRDVVIKMGRESDGEDQSWTVPIYIFNFEILSARPSYEDDPPENNGDPHPFHGPVLPGEQQQVTGLADQYMDEILQHNPFPLLCKGTILAVPAQSRG